MPLYGHSGYYPYGVLYRVGSSIPRLILDNNINIDNDIGTEDIGTEDIRVDFPIRLSSSLSEKDIQEINKVLNIRSIGIISYSNSPKIAFFTRYNGRLKLNRRGGPAVIYNSGDSQYWIRGRKISDELIRKLFEENMSGLQILFISNIEDRRDAMECIGSNEFANRIGSFLRPVHSSTLNGQLYSLYVLTYDELSYDEYAYMNKLRSERDDILIPFDDIYFLKVIDSSTTREYYLQVPPSQDAIESLAWTFGMTKREYLPIVET